LGRCPGCGQYASLIEENLRRQDFKEERRRIFSSPDVVSLSQLPEANYSRISTGLSEFDRVLGGGLVNGSVVLLGGKPGIGKSTLTLQAACCLANQNEKVLLVSGEESPQQVKMRAARIGATSKNLYLLPDIDIYNIESAINKVKPKVVIIDSIQTLYSPELSSSPGSISQVRDCAARLVAISKSEELAMIIIGHVTKDGAIAGPRVLEHLVDVVLYFEEKNYHNYRVVRAVKNRFGCTNEIAIFEMKSSGIEGVSNASSIFLNQHRGNSSGSIVVAAMEGSRPLLVELQALVTRTYLNMPRRLVNGADYNRALLMLAVLDKRAGLHFSNYDVHINVAGGIRLIEPAADLGLALSTASALTDRCLTPDTAVFGEVGLGGEIRFTSDLEARIAEAKKLGFKKVILPVLSKKELKTVTSHNISLIQVKTLQEAVELLN
jgi:DNA repair protein RadA/Sms